MNAFDAMLKIAFKDWDNFEFELQVELLRKKAKELSDTRWLRQFSGMWD